MAEKLDIKNIIRGIRDSPLEDEVKQEAIGVVRGQEQQIRQLLIDARYRAPETGIHSQIAQYVINILLTPLFKKRRVPKPNGRDTMRHIYVAIGGSNPVNYELV